MKIDLLDKGYVRLVESMGNDLSIVRAARVSYNADWRAGTEEKSDEKLLRYLWKHRHTSPFEAVTLTFEVKAPIFIFRQWHRHRTQSYNEVSARYTELPDEYYIPDAKIIGVQDKRNKQTRNITGGHLEGCDYWKIDLEDEHHDCTCGFANTEAVVDNYADHCQSSFDEYRNLLDAGWPRELARMVLPLSTYSRMFTTMNLLNLFRFLTLRTHEHAQWEIQQYANALTTCAATIAPISVSAWRDSQSP